MSGFSSEFGYPAGLAAKIYSSLFSDPLIAPMLDSNQNWLIHAQGLYSSVPFAALIASDTVPADVILYGPDELRLANWLGLEKSLAIIPSVASIKLARENPIEFDEKRREPFFGIGAPNFSGAESSGVHRAESYFRNGVANVREVRLLPSLPQTEPEIRAIAEILGARKGSFLLGADATEKELRRFNQTGALGRARIVALATHGLIAGELGEHQVEPALALTPPVDDIDIDHNDDGLLLASEVALLDFSADWVILSACNTAAGGEPGSEMLSGLARSFFAAGAQSLLVSQFSVYDDAAEKLSTTAVKLAIEENIGRPEALRRSMIMIMTDTSKDNEIISYAHPANWAPFFIIDPS